MKTLILSAAATLALIGVAPALAQHSAGATSSPHQMPLKVVTRTQVAEHAQQLFAKLDTNRDGAVTQAEAAAFKQTRGERMGDKRFDRLDSNKDGVISRSEFDSAHQSMAGHRSGMKMHGGFAGRMFTMADGNKDGRVTIQEATAAATAHFDAADSNHDGTLSAEEMQAAHRLMRGKAGR